MFLPKLYSVFGRPDKPTKEQPLFTILSTTEFQNCQIINFQINLEKRTIHFDIVHESKKFHIPVLIKEASCR